MYDRPFRWWVQSVMPLVFDDSLSYYEVLAKLTKYIEGLTGDVEQIEKILATIEGIEDVTQFTEFLETIQAEIGNLENLQTDTKVNLVSAINEVALKADIAYWKPPTGIPESDLSQEVKDKLNRVVSSTEYIINNVKLNPAPANNSPNDLGLGTYTVPDGGIPWNTLSSDVRDRITGAGGGGTTNYDDLNNKPQINGHTLNAGDNTNESLGLGTYSKPNTGIPESDLSAEVQEKLNTSGGIADNQESFVASRDYEAGELVYINGVLYKVKYKILAGTNMIPGNNIETTDISAEIERINNDIDALQSGAGPDSWSLVADLTSNSAVNYVNFFEYFNAIGGENYLFICTPNSSNESPYQISILKRDGTVVYTFNSQSAGNQERFTFTPADNGEYYCRIKKIETTPPTETNAVVNVRLEYTQSQGMTELWTQVNKATELEPRVSAVETLVGQQEQRIENLESGAEDLIGIQRNGYFQLLASDFEKSEWNSTGTKSGASRTICYKEKIPVQPGDKLIIKESPLYIGWYLVADGTDVERYYTSSGQRYLMTNTEFIFRHSGDLLINIGNGNRYATSTSINPSDMTADIYAQLTLAGRLSTPLNNLLTSVDDNEINYVNLAGMEPHVTYPVNIPANTKITMSTADGTAYGSVGLNLYLCDADKNAFESYNFSQALTSRTFSPSADVKYLAWGTTPAKLVQVEIGDRPTEYHPYHYPIGKRISEIENNIDSFISRDIFNGEPYEGIYDWQTPIASYGALFKGKANVEAFAFFTDSHVMGFEDSSRNELNMHEYIKKVSKVLRSAPCKFAVNGGDWLNNSTTMNEACYRLGYIKALAKNMLCDCKLVVGNHDTNYQGKLDSDSENGTGRLTNATIAALLFNDTETRKAYYSFDGIRSKCYVLDSGTEHNTMLEYDWEQIAWLAEKLGEDDPAHAIIFIHIIVNNGNTQANATNFGTLVEAYNNHTTVTLNSISYDFTSCSGHVDFWVAGHTHSDSNGTLGGIPYFITASNGYQSDTPVIDLALADYDNNMLYLKRIGETGNDRTISLTTGALIT